MGPNTTDTVVGVWGGGVEGWDGGQGWIREQDWDKDRIPEPELLNQS